MGTIFDCNNEHCDKDMDSDWERGREWSGFASQTLPYGWGLEVK